MKNSITKKQIDKLMCSSKFTYRTEFGKCTVVTMQLPNGFVLTESSACVDPKNYDEKLGYEICIKKLTERVWELEGYKLQDQLYERNKPQRNVEDITVGELAEKGFLIQFDNFTLNERAKVIIGGRE